ncbi:BppB (plasmid) [Borreliella chilensis]|uniref:BppB n=1 Tax=Borreliella chilensis TaxID=1245910 RepID=A0A0A7UX88_9SPIR|nr:BppB [Borreliella chilensis]
MFVEKILQSNGELLKDVQKFGCYFLSLHYWIFVLTGFDFKAKDINVNYQRFLELGYIRNDCYILNPCKILRYYKIFSKVRYESPLYLPIVGKEFEITEIRLTNKDFVHFIAMDNNKVLYDSLDLKSKSKKFKIISKRIFNYFA